MRTTVAVLSRLEIEQANRPGASRAQCVAAIVEQVLDELEVVEPPVDVEMLASLLGIREVVQDARLDAAACLICGEDGVRIRVRAHDSDERQRFSVCHECSHTFFPGFAQRTRYRCFPGLAFAPQKEQTLEQLCDSAASALLLPRRLLAPVVAGTPLSLSLIEEIGGAYGASIEASAHRVVNLAPAPVALLVFEVRQAPRQEGTNAEPRLRMRTAHGSPGGYWPYFIPHKSVDDRSAFGRALAGEDINELATLDGICRQRLHVRVMARAYPYWVGADYRERVLALLRPVKLKKIGAA